MYAPYRDRLCPGTAGFSLPRILAENLLYLATWTVAGALLWPVWRPAGVPVVGLAWIGLVLLVQVLLKKHNCGGCWYYGRSCHLGWGRLAAWMFPPDTGNLATGQRLSLFYIASPPAVLLTSIGWGLLASAGAGYWALVGLFVVLNAASFPVRKAGCSVCRMRNVCFGSAVKPGTSGMDPPAREDDRALSSR